jgi:hypothetical protein
MSRNTTHSYGGEHCLNDERARLVAQGDSPAHRQRIAEYNRQLAIFNQRLARFQQLPRDVLSTIEAVDHNVVTGYVEDDDDF